MQTLSGKSISQLDALPDDGRISAADRFFTSEPVAPGSRYGQYLSKHLRYDVLLERVFADLSAGFGFGRMAWELSDAYALSGHTHPYNSLNMSVDYDQQDDRAGMVIASFRIDGRLVRLRVPLMWTYEYPEPEIGELKFTALPPASEIDVNAEDFDGWVYPDGTTYIVAADDFADAKERFGQEPDSTRLTVPRLSGFFKADTDAADAEWRRFSNTGVPHHMHTAAIRVNGGSRKINVKVRTTYKAGNGGSLHNGLKKTGNWVSQGSLVFDVKQFNIDRCDIGNSEAALDREQYPPFNMLPAMIYIGKRG